MPNHEAYTAVTAVGVGGTESIMATNELPVDMHPKMETAYTALTPLTTILTKMENTSATNYRVDWIEKKEIPTTVMVATTESSAGTTVVIVENGETLVLDTLLYNPDKDDLRRVTTAGTSTNSIAVAISQGGKTSSIWEAGDIIHVLPPAIAESDSGNYRNVSVADTNVYNLQQLIRMQYCLTRIQAKVKTHFGNKRDELKAQKYREFRIKKEKLAYFGGRSTSGDASEDELRLSGGLVHYLKDGTLYKDFNGILSESGFRQFIGDYKDQNPDTTEVWCYAAGNVIDIITDFNLPRVQMKVMEKTGGLDIDTYKCRGIKVHLVALPLLDTGVTAGWGFLLDMSRIRQKTLDKDMFYPDALNVGESELIYDTYRSVTSLMVANETRHAMFVGADL
jgi:hypothetical protein